MEKIQEICHEVNEIVMKNAPEYSHYMNDLNWKIRKFHDKGKYKMIANVEGNTIHVNESELNNPRIIHHFEHELAHYIDTKLNGLSDNSHDDNFFDILEKITGTPERQKYRDGIYRGVNE